MSAGEPGPGPDYRRRHTAPTPSAAASAQQRQRTLDAFLANHNGRGAKDPPAYRAADRPRERRRRATAAAAQPMPQVQPRRDRARGSVRQQPRGVSAPTEKSELRQQPPPRGVRSEERQHPRSRGVSATREQQPHHQSHTRRERHRIDKRIDHRSEHSRDRRRRPLEPEEDIIVHACHAGGPDDGIFSSLPPQRRGLSQSRGMSQGRGLSSPRKVTGRGGRGSERPASMPPARRRASSSDSSDMNSDAGSSSSSSSGSSSSTSSNTSSKKRRHRDPPLRRKSTENTQRTEPSTIVDETKLDPMQRTPSHLALVDMLEGLWNGPAEASGTMYSSVEAHVGSERWGVQKTPTRCREEANADDGSSTSTSSSDSDSGSSLDSSTCPTEPPEPKSYDNNNDSSITFDSLYSCRTQPPSSPATSFLRRHSAHNHVVQGGRPKHHTKSEIVYVKDQLKKIKQRREIIRQRVETEGIAAEGTTEGTYGEKGESFHLDESTENRSMRNGNYGNSSMGASGFGNSSLYISDIESLNLSDIEELKRSSF